MCIFALPGIPYGLRGAMFWDVTGDDTQGTLLHSVYAGLTGR